MIRSKKGCLGQLGNSLIVVLKTKMKKAFLKGMLVGWVGVEPTTVHVAAYPFAYRPI